jgi:hypothetical protein
MLLIPPVLSMLAAEGSSMSKWILRTTLAILVLAVVHERGHSLVWTSQGGDWPKHWPLALEPLRAGAITIHAATGSQEHIYEISFSSSEEFLKAWPALLQVRTPGGPLRLRRISVPKPRSWESIASNATPKVRIYAPDSNSNRQGTVADYDPDGPTEEEKPKMLPYKLGPPWPAELVGKQGELPEYVQAIPRDGKAVLVALKPDEKPRGFRNRARVDIELVVDGEVIDLNRIEFPKDALIIDRRFEADDSN